MVVYLGDVEHNNERCTDRPLPPGVTNQPYDNYGGVPLPIGFISLSNTERNRNEDGLPVLFSSVDYQVLEGKLHVEPSHYKGVHKTALYEESEDDQPIYEETEKEAIYER